jgi:hypothetical protein
MSEIKSPVKYELSQCAGKYLRDLLNTAGWADDLFKIRHGAVTLDLIPEGENEPTAPKTNDQVELFRRDSKIWADTLLPEFELNDKQIKATKSCLNFYIKKATLPANKYTLEILNAFDIRDE